MLTVSETAMRAFHIEGLRSLRQRILSGWVQRLHSAGERVGEEGRSRILAEIDQLSQQDRTLTVADLNMLADIMLVAAANEVPEQ